MNSASMIVTRNLPNKKCAHPELDHAPESSSFSHTLEGPTYPQKTLLITGRHSWDGRTRHRSFMKKRMIFSILLLVLVTGGLAGVKLLQIRMLMAAGQGYTPPPEIVSSAVVREEKWQPTLSAVGSIMAVQGVNITAELPGIVRDISFESGTEVKKGDLLLRLDTSSEEAQLRALEAQAELARIESERLGKLRAEKMISESELDSAQATLKQTRANADAVRATIEKKTIRAPFAGHLGLRLVNVGEYVDAGKAIVSLQSLDTLYADFSLPQQDLAQLQTGMRVRISTDTYADQSVEGKLMAINPDLDAMTRSVRLRAVFDNPEERLRPGMFARVEVLLPHEQPVLVVPMTAVRSEAFGESVYVIEKAPATNVANAGLIVRQQFVRTGRARGDFVAVETGLKPGERVVSAGVFKLRNRMPVTENNSVVPGASQTPKPSEG
jgi:membrane fusion protein (multidrug efflux system)